MEENFPATEIATEALTQAVAFLVAQPELALRPGMKEINEMLSGEKDRSIWKPEGGWVGGHGDPRPAPGTASYPLQANSCSRGSKDGKNDNTGWRLVLFKALGDVPDEREEALAFFLKNLQACCPQAQPCSVPLSALGHNSPEGKQCFWKVSKQSTPC